MQHPGMLEIESVAFEINKITVNQSSTKQNIFCRKISEKYGIKNIYFKIRIFFFSYIAYIQLLYTKQNEK